MTTASEQQCICCATFCIRKMKIKTIYPYLLCTQNWKDIQKNKVIIYGDRVDGHISGNSDLPMYNFLYCFDFQTIQMH